jgi:hypothetical protein
VFDGQDTEVDTRWVKDGSFIRGQNLTLTYDVGKPLATRLGVDRLQLHLNAQNFFLITRYEGTDPEISTYGNVFAQGIEFFGYPKPRTVNFGITAQF